MIGIKTVPRDSRLSPPRSRPASVIYLYNCCQRPPVNKCSDRSLFFPPAQPCSDVGQPVSAIGRSVPTLLQLQLQLPILHLPPLCKLRSRHLPQLSSSSKTAFRAPLKSIILRTHRTLLASPPSNLLASLVQPTRQRFPTLGSLPRPFLPSVSASTFDLPYSISPCLVQCTTIHPPDSESVSQLFTPCS